MLKRAILHKDALQKKFIETWDNPAYRFYDTMSYRTSYAISDSDWNRVEYVSVDKEDNIIGFLSANYDRDAAYISGIGILNFVSHEANVSREKRMNASKVFASDIRRFIKTIIRPDMRSIRIGVVVGNPALPRYFDLLKRSKYNWVCESYHVQVDKLMDGSYYDSVSLRIFLQPTEVPLAVKESSSRIVEHVREFYKEDINEQGIA